MDKRFITLIIILTLIIAGYFFYKGKADVKHPTPEDIFNIYKTDPDNNLIYTSEIVCRNDEGIVVECKG